MKKPFFGGWCTWKSTTNDGYNHDSVAAFWVDEAACQSVNWKSAAEKILGAKKPICAPPDLAKR